MVKPETLIFSTLQDRGTDPSNIYGHDDYYAPNSQEYREMGMVSINTFSNKLRNTSACASHQKQLKQYSIL